MYNVKKFRPIKMGETNKGERLAISENPQIFANFSEDGVIVTRPLTDGITYTVYVETTNYSAGRDVKTWKYIVKNVTLTEAEKVFKRRSKKEPK